MARRKRLGSVAAKVFGYGDVDTMVTGAAHHAMLEAHHRLEQRAVREATERFVGRLRLKRANIAQHLAARAQHRAEVAAKAADRVDVVERWRQLGIRERMTIRTIPKGLKWGLWLLIASLDFYIFAQVMAYAENIADPGPGDATFWLGGAVGITVFIVGILLGQAIRRASYYHAQKKLLRELEAAGEDTTGLRLSNYSRMMTLSFGLFYIALTAGAVVLRYQGGGKEQPGLLLLQTAIPVIGIMLELLVDDPTEVRLPQRTLWDWWLSHRLRRLDNKIELRKLIAAEREAAVADRYRFESAALASLHESHGIDPQLEATEGIEPPAEELTSGLIAGEDVASPAGEAALDVAAAAASVIANGDSPETPIAPAPQVAPAPQGVAPQVAPAPQVP